MLEKVIKKEDKFKNTFRKCEKDKQALVNERKGQIKEILDRNETNTKYVNN